MVYHCPMADSQFFFFLAIAVVSFGLHGALIVSFVRRYDALVVALYRGLSLIVTMLPFLFFVSFEDIVAIREHIPLLLISSIVGALAFTLSLTGSRYLPVGIATSIRQTTIVPVAICIGWLFLGEHLTSIQTILLIGVGICAVALSFLRSNHAHLHKGMVRRGVFLCICAGVLAALFWFFFSIMARNVNPLVAAYFSEAGVGIVVLVYLLFLRGIGKHSSNIWLPSGEVFKIGAVALLTIFATGSYAIAVNHGPYPLASGVMVGTILVSTLAGWFVFKEHLTKMQVAVIFVGVILMFLIRIVS